MGKGKIEVICKKKIEKVEKNNRENKMSDNESEEEYEVEAIVDFRDEGKLLLDSDFC